MIDLFSALSITAGLFFFIAGTAGIFRLPDTLCRLHAVTKADNLGLGLVMLGVLLQLSDLLSILKVLLIWLLILAASAVSGQMIANQINNHKEDIS